MTDGFDLGTFISLLATFATGSGIAWIFTLKATKKQANAEADKAQADAHSAAVEAATQAVELSQRMMQQAKDDRDESRRERDEIRNQYKETASRLDKLEMENSKIKKRITALIPQLCSVEGCTKRRVVDCTDVE